MAGGRRKKKSVRAQRIHWARSRERARMFSLDGLRMCRKSNSPATPGREESLGERWGEKRAVGRPPSSSRPPKNGAQSDQGNFETFPFCQRSLRAHSQVYRAEGIFVAI